jgi:lambda family phage tail tape measure protein
MTTPIDEVSIRVSADATPFTNSLKELSRQTASFSSAISKAFTDAVVGGKNFESVLKTLALRLADMALQKALAPVSNAIGGAISSLFGAFGLARGGVVEDGQVRRFASGGVVAAPTLFPLAHGLGLMGEAGAEAVLPLARGSDGKLGVRSDGVGAAPINVTFNVTTADAASFARSEAQVTAMLARAVARGRRGL